MEEWEQEMMKQVNRMKNNERITRIVCLTYEVKYLHHASSASSQTGESIS